MNFLQSMISYIWLLTLTDAEADAFPKLLSSVCLFLHAEMTRFDHLLVETTLHLHGQKSTLVLSVIPVGRNKPASTSTVQRSFVEFEQQPTGLLIARYSSHAHKRDSSAKRVERAVGGGDLEKAAGRLVLA